MTIMMVTIDVHIMVLVQVITVLAHTLLLLQLQLKPLQPLQQRSSFLNIGSGPVFI
jgi:hypothetical protein